MKRVVWLFICLAAWHGLPAQAQVEDLSGYWAPILTEDFELRTMGARKGDYGGIDLNQAGREAADRYAAGHPDDGYLFSQCGPHGPPAILFTDTRLYITRDDKTLTMQLEAEGRTREFHLGTVPAGSGLTWQGRSTAFEEGKSLLTVITRDMQPGLLRDNGVPYSDQAVLTEHFTRHDDLFTVIVVVEDPEYLTAPFIKSTSFRRIQRPADWNMGSCRN